MSLELHDKRGQGKREWATVTLNNSILGMVEIVPEGYITSGKRKPVATLQLAAKQLIDRRISAALQEAQTWRNYIGLLRQETGPIPSK